jgi:hypothetical protein
MKKAAELKRLGDSPILDRMVEKAREQEVVSPNEKRGEIVTHRSLVRHPQIPTPSASSTDFHTIDRSIPRNHGSQPSQLSTMRRRSNLDTRFALRAYNFYISG